MLNQKPLYMRSHRGCKQVIPVVATEHLAVGKLQLRFMKIEYFIERSVNRIDCIVKTLDLEPRAGWA